MKAPEEESIEDQEEAEDLYEHHRILVDKGQQPLRIDRFLLSRLQAVSRTRIQRAAEQQSILVNGLSVKSNYKVRPGDEIVILLPEPRMEFTAEPENIPLNIVYEDEWVIVINKPAGLVVHPGAGNYTGTLVNGLLHHFSLLPVPPVQPYRPGLVHRIDKDTSGLLVIAKTGEALQFLSEQFSNHTIRRVYQALVWGEFKEPEGTIRAFIGRNLRNRKLMDVFPEGDHGKEAVTHYEVIESLGYVSLVQCRLETGRTHQIRVHMKSIGHPLFGDVSYGGDKIVKGTVYSKYKQFVENCFSILPRQALHARSIGFIHPATRQLIEFDSELPEDMNSVLEKWRKYMQK